MSDDPARSVVDVPVIRTYRPGDLRALLRMYEDFEPRRAAQGLPPDDPVRIRRWLDDVLDRGIHAVAASGGAIVGHVMLIPCSRTTVELANFVHQAWRGRGLGTELNRAAVGLARDAGWQRVWLCVDPSNRAAIRSYAKAGFAAPAATKWGPEIEMEFDLGARGSAPNQPDAA